MCGRFTLIANPETLSSNFDLDASLSPDLNELMPRYNVAPSQPVAAIVGSDEGVCGVDDGEQPDHLTETKQHLVHVYR